MIDVWWVHSECTCSPFKENGTCIMLRSAQPCSFSHLVKKICQGIEMADFRPSATPCHSVNCSLGVKQASRHHVCCLQSCAWPTTFSVYCKGVPLPCFPREDCDSQVGKNQLGQGHVLQLQRYIRSPLLVYISIHLHLVCYLAFPSLNLPSSLSSVDR